MATVPSSRPRRGVRRAAAALALAVVASGGVVAGAGSASAANIGKQGCTPGYWKNHTSNWQEYTPGTRLGSVFMLPAGELRTAFATKTFLQALQGGGGSGLTGATTVLMRAGVASYLNAAHEGLGYPYRRGSMPGNLQKMINDALASKDRTKILAVAAQLDKANNLGCPLN